MEANVNSRFCNFLLPTSQVSGGSVP